MTAALSTLIPVVHKKTQARCTVWDGRHEAKSCSHSMGQTQRPVDLIYRAPPLPSRPDPMFNKSFCLRLAGLTLLAAGTVDAAQPRLSTLAERTGFQQTGRYEEVIELCAGFARRWPREVRCEEFGRTPEGRPMLALIASSSGVLEAKAAARKALPVQLIQGGIHAGEIDGKDAGFLALREVLEGKLGSGALKHQVLVFVPVFNVDGHERFGAWNRPNQNGPQEMGWRTTAQNYNLNRDYAKADSVEMQAMLKLVQTWDPLVYVDLHVTNGAKFEHDISVQIEPNYAGDSALRNIGRQLRDAVLTHLTEQGSLPLSFYPSFVVNDDPTSGFVDGVAQPRFSTGYFHLRNRLGVLVETHSWKDYPTRVRRTRDTIISLLEQVAKHGQAWRREALAADARAATLAGQEVALDYLASDRVRTIQFRGYAYTRMPSAISGGLMTHYDDQQPQVWMLPMRDDVQPSLTVRAPGAGYLVPAAQARTVASRLAVHGIQFQFLQRGSEELEAEVFRAETSSFSTGSFEGRQRLTVTGSWTQARQALVPGMLFVPIRQARARLVMALLEPSAPDSLLAWGEFNNHFESKEYMEAYVAETVAREQLASDPELAAAFAHKLASDPEFARSPAARLGFFARRHPSWDQRLGLYPVMRVASHPAEVKPAPGR